MVVSYVRVTSIRHPSWGDFSYEQQLKRKLKIKYVNKDQVNLI